MRIKAGKYTLALTMILAGVLIIINSFYGLNLFDNLWICGAAVLIMFGLEVIILSIIYSNKENYKVEVSTGSIILIILIFVFFTAWTNKIEIRGPFFDNFDFMIY
ncbi:MAG: hypothetical protein Q8876_10200 [Bacillota bacterium]|nr:hypothetical protein [Bacillota bacterium]